MLSWALDRLKPMLCHSGTENRQPLKYLKEKGVHYENYCCLGWAAITKEATPLVTLVATWSHSRFCWVNARALISPASKRGPVWTHNSVHRVSFFTGHFGHPDALCFMFFSSHYWLLPSYDSHFIFPEKAISRILLIFFLARLLDSFRTGRPCVRWPSLATRPERFTWMGLQVHQSLTCCILGF